MPSSASCIISSPTALFAGDDGHRIRRLTEGRRPIHPAAERTARIPPHSIRDRRRVIGKGEPMQRTLFAGIAVVVLLAGCGPQAPAPRQVAVPPDDASNGPPQIFGNPNPDHPVPVTPVAGPEGALASDKQDRYTASLLDALDLLAQKKQAQALAAPGGGQGCPE